MPFDEFKQKIKLVIDIKFEIIKIYDLNDEMIDENEWREYGIIINKPKMENKWNKEWKHKELMLILDAKNKQNNELKDVLDEERKEKVELNEKNNRLNDRINVLMNDKQSIKNQWYNTRQENELLLKERNKSMSELDKKK
eukprot:485430_1